MNVPSRVFSGRAAAWLIVAFIVAILIAIPDPQEFARAHGAKRRLAIATGGGRVACGTRTAGASRA